MRYESSLYIKKCQESLLRHQRFYYLYSSITLSEICLQRLLQINSLVVLKNHKQYIS